MTLPASTQDNLEVISGTSVAATANVEDLLALLPAGDVPFPTRFDAAAYSALAARGHFLLWYCRLL